MKQRLEFFFFFFFISFGAGGGGVAEAAAEARNLGRRYVGLCFSMHYISLVVLTHQSILLIRLGSAWCTMLSLVHHSTCLLKVKKLLTTEN